MLGQIFSYRKPIDRTQDIMNPDEDNCFLIIAPHPDDEILGPGGFIANASKVHSKISVVILTDGAKGSQEINMLADSAEREIRIQDLVKKRREACLNATSELGIKSVKFLDGRDGSLEKDMARITSKVYQLISELRPDVIFMPHRYEWHPDHKASWTLVSRAHKALPGVLAKKIDLWCYEVWTPLNPTLVIDITENIPLKRKALNHYKPYFDNLDLDSALLGLNCYRAASNLFINGYAEAFSRLA